MPGRAPRLSCASWFVDASMICSCVNCDFLPIPSSGALLEDSRFGWSSFRGACQGVSCSASLMHRRFSPAHLLRLLPFIRGLGHFTTGTENPPVGGSIPPLGTVLAD